MPDEIRTPEESFRQLHECICDASWSHSGRGTTVRQMDCVICFEREMEPMRRGIEKQIWLEATELACWWCSLSEPEWRHATYPGEQWWHTTVQGDKLCMAGNLWTRIKEE